MLTISLDWPELALSPNARVHWRVLREAKHEALDAAYWATTLALRNPTNGNATDTNLMAGDGVIPVKLTFHPPNKRRRDLDNFQASQKAALDGIARALEVDDHRFRPVSDWGDVRKPGVVIVEIG